MIKRALSLRLALSFGLLVLPGVAGASDGPQREGVVGAVFREAHETPDGVVYFDRVINAPLEDDGKSYAAESVYVVRCPDPAPSNQCEVKSASTVFGLLDDDDLTFHGAGPSSARLSFRAPDVECNVATQWCVETSRVVTRAISWRAGVGTDDAGVCLAGFVPAAAFTTGYAPPIGCPAVMEVGGGEPRHHETDQGWFSETPRVPDPNADRPGLHRPGTTVLVPDYADLLADHVRTEEPEPGVLMKTRTVAWLVEGGGIRSVLIDIFETRCHPGCEFFDNWYAWESVGPDELKVLPFTDFALETELTLIPFDDRPPRRVNVSGRWKGHGVPDPRGRAWLDVRLNHCEVAPGYSTVTRRPATGSLAIDGSDAGLPSRARMAMGGAVAGGVYPCDAVGFDRPYYR